MRHVIESDEREWWRKSGGDESRWSWIGFESADNS